MPGQRCFLERENTNEQRNVLPFMSLAREGGGGKGYEQETRLGANETNS